MDIDYDVIGLLGIDRSIPSEATAITYTVRLKGKPGVTPEQLAKCKEVIDTKSPVVQTLAQAIPMKTVVIVE